MDVFQLRDQLTQDYADYVSSFIQIQDDRIYQLVESNLAEGVFWPDPLIQLNPTFKPGGRIDELVQQGILHRDCNTIFRKGKERGESRPLQLHQHQRDAIRAAQGEHNYILTTGTGSGKSLGYIVPIVDDVLKHPERKGIKAIIVYPMNALANSQAGELRKFLQDGYPDGRGPVTFARYTGQENDEQRKAIIANPPDILLTNYVMLELLMTRPRERKLIEQSRGLRFLVLDELHTYRGRQGADVALLMRRVRDRLEEGSPIQFVGTSATLASEGRYTEQRQQVATVATQLFGVAVQPEHVIGETLERATPERHLDSLEFSRQLIDAVQVGEALETPSSYEAFTNYPLSTWIESTFGVQMREGRLVRTLPRSIRGEEGAARELSQRVVATF